MKVTSFGGGQVFLHSFLGEVAKKLEEDSRRRTYAAAQEVRRRWVKLLSGRRAGRWYRVPGTGKRYQASKPGQPPASRLADLRRSVKAASRRGDDGMWEGLVGSDMRYAPWLEYGTGRRGAAEAQGDLPPGYVHGPSKGMSPRPSLRPALGQARGRVRVILGRPMDL